MHSSQFVAEFHFLSFDRLLLSANLPAAEQRVNCRSFSVDISLCSVLKYFMSLSLSLSLSLSPTERPLRNQSMEGFAINRTFISSVLTCVPVIFLLICSSTRVQACTNWHKLAHLRPQFDSPNFAENLLTAAAGPIRLKLSIWKSRPFHCQLRSVTALLNVNHSL